jgi:hypothetical protein
MLTQMMTNTPHWVWGLLVVLLWQGLKQTLPRTASLKRITLMPVAMTALSLYGTVSAFGATPAVLLVWLGAASVMAMVVQQHALPESTRYNPMNRTFALPGSWVPLVLIMGLFVTKYVVGAVSATQPALAHGSNFALCFSALYGAFSGVFLSRSARLWRLALASNPARGFGTPTAAMT